MKKILALALAIVMMAAIAVPAFAAPTSLDQGDNPNEDKSATTTVTYGVNKTYTVTVPDAVAFGTSKATTAEVSAADVVIPGNEQLVVSVVSAAGRYQVPNSSVIYDTQTDDAKVAWTMVEETKNGSNAVPYSVYVGAAGAQEKPQDAEALTNDAGTVLTVNSSTNQGQAATGGAKLFFETAGTNQSGRYIDTLTFTVALDEIA